MPATRKTIGVVGLGHVGLPYAAALAHVGFDVVGVDISVEHVNQLSKESRAYLYEPSLDETLRTNRSRLTFTTDYAMLKKCSCIFVCVGSETKDGGSSIDMSQLDGAIRQMAPNLQSGQLIVLKSTVKPLTTEVYLPAMIQEMSGKRAGEDYFLCYSPERTIEGLALHEIYTLPKIVGGIDGRSADLAAEVLSKLGGGVIRVSSPAVAELCKLMDNLYRSTNIALANELGILCESIGIDSLEVVSATNQAYVRTRLFKPGLGADGPCLTKDPQIFALTMKERGLKPTLAASVIESNAYSTARIARIISEFCSRRKVRSPKVALVGLSFKGFPENDDIRGSPALKIMEKLKSEDASYAFSFYDPLVSQIGGNRTATSIEDCITGCNVVVFLTNHLQLMNVAIGEVVRRGARPLLVVDCWHNTSGAPDSDDVELFRVGQGTSPKVGTKRER